MTARFWLVTYAVGTHLLNHWKSNSVWRDLPMQKLQDSLRNELKSRHIKCKQGFLSPVTIVTPSLKFVETDARVGN